MKQDHFDNVSVAHIFERSNKGLRVSRTLADFLSREYKIAITCELTRKGESLYFWKREHEATLSEDPFVLDFVKSPFSWQKTIGV